MRQLVDCFWRAARAGCPLLLCRKLCGFGTRVNRDAHSTRGHFSRASHLGRWGLARLAWVLVERAPYAFAPHILDGHFWTPLTSKLALLFDFGGRFSRTGAMAPPVAAGRRHRLQDPVFSVPVFSNKRASSEVRGGPKMPGPHMARDNPPPAAVVDPEPSRAAATRVPRDFAGGENVAGRTQRPARKAD